MAEDERGVKLPEDCLHSSIHGSNSLLLFKKDEQENTFNLNSEDTSPNNIKEEIEIFDVTESGVNKECEINILPDDCEVVEVVSLGDQPAVLAAEEIVNLDVMDSGVHKECEISILDHDYEVVEVVSLVDQPTVSAAEEIEIFDVTGSGVDKEYEISILDHDCEVVEVVSLVDQPTVPAAENVGEVNTNLSTVPLFQTPVIEVNTSPVKSLLHKTESCSTFRAELLYGKRMDSLIIYDSVGYFYHKDREKKSAGKTYTTLRCTNRNCPGRAVLKLPLVNGAPIYPGRPHNHHGDPEKKEILKARKIMRDRAFNEPTPLNIIYDQEISRLPNEIAEKMDKNSVIYCLKKAQKTQAKLPSSESHLKDINMFNTELRNIPVLMSGKSSEGLNLSEDEENTEEQEEFSKKSNVLQAELLYGKRTSSLIIYDSIGYYYHKERGKSISETTYTTLRCVNRKCPGRALLMMPLVNGAPLYPGRRHNHHADPDNREILIAHKKMKDRAANESTPLNVIYDEEISRLPDKIAAKLVKDHVMCCLRYARNAQSKLPRSKTRVKVSNPPAESPHVVKFIPGQEKHNVIFDGMGYFYHIERINNATQVVLRCKIRKCCGRGYTTYPFIEGAAIQITQYHDHKEDFLYYDVLELKYKLLRRAASELTPIPTLISEECKNYRQEVVMRPELSNIKAKMREIQRRNFPSQCIKKFQPKKNLNEYFENPELCRTAKVFLGTKIKTCTVYDGVGYFYHRYSKGETVVTLRCIDRNCKGRAVMEVNGCRFVEIQSHDHGPDNSRLPEMEFKHRIVERSRTESTPWKVIFREECAKLPKKLARKFKNLKYAEHYSIKVKKGVEEQASSESDVEMEDLYWYRADNTNSAADDSGLSNSAEITHSSEEHEMDMDIDDKDDVDMAEEITDMIDDNVPSATEENINTMHLNESQSENLDLIHESKLISDDSEYDSSDPHSLYFEIIRKDHYY